MADEEDLARHVGSNAAHRVAINTAVQVAARVFGAIVGIVQTGFLSHFLHSRAFGQFGFVLSVIGLCGILGDLGVTNVAIRSLNQNPAEARARTLGGMLTARAMLGGFAVIASDSFAFVGHLDSVVADGIVLMSATYLLTIPGQLFAVFQAELELQYPMIVNSVQVVFGLGIVIFLIERHASLLQLLGAQAVLVTLGAWCTALLATRRYKLAIEPNFRVGLQMARHALPVGIGIVLTTVYFRIDTILLGLIRGPVDVAHYTAAYKLIDLAVFGSTALISSVYPIMVRISATADQGKLLQTYQATTDVMLLVAIPVTVAWLILAGPIISLVYPPDFHPSIAALRILSFVLVPLFFNSVLTALVLTLHRERTFLWISLGAVILNVGLNLVFIPRAGILAASVITVVSEVIVTIAGSYLMWRAIRFIPSVRVAGLAVCTSLIMALPVYILRDYLFGASLVGGLLYLVLTRLLGLWSWVDVRALLKPAS
jgi:O-antigen/teichoic acid export membrane protein